jgi:sterol desaturase/sphingolipid hydroxylase (fatty acid hydroxylase superfamily)
MDRTLSESPIKSLLLAITITHWRIPHFWMIHRAMHPWKTDSFPDIGEFLYKKVHSLHHKSHNPTAFSGTSMHPVESTLYYSASLLVIPFAAHPTIVIGCIFDCAVGAWLGHDGFQWPGSGDYFHQLHHKHFDCNYGAMHVPIDKWLGTFSAGKGDSMKKIWGDKKSGADANATKVHD